MERKVLEDMRSKELAQIAKNRMVKGWWKMRKNELVEALSTNEETMVVRFGKLITLEESVEFNMKARTNA